MIAVAATVAVATLLAAVQAAPHRPRWTGVAVLATVHTVTFICGRLVLRGAL